MNLTKFLGCLFLAMAASGAEVGDSLDKVVAEKGSPKSQIEVGPVRILHYADVTIKLRDNVVVSVSAVSGAERQSASTPSASALTPAARLAATRSEAKDAITRVQNIVNQAITMAQRTPQMRVWEYEYWFHPGAAKPDFNTVDVRLTQQLDYENQDFVCLKSNPTLVWAGHDLEFNAMTKFFYVDRSVPKKRLTNEEMVEVNRLYRIIGRCEKELNQAGVQLQPSS